MRFSVLPFVLLAALAAPLRAGDMYQPTFEIGAPEGTLRGLVLSADSQPVAGAEVVAIATPRPGYQGLFADDPTGPTLAATSDAEGKFSLSVTRERPFELRVRTTDGRIAYVPTCHPREIVTVRVAAPAQIEIELVDAASGSPLAGVEVAAQWTETSHLRQFVSVPHRIATATTNAAGLATIANLSPGPIEIVYEPGTSGLSPARNWRVLAGEKSRLRVRVADARRTYAGRITDRAGNPVPGARVAASLRFDRFTIADDEGRFEWTSFLPVGEAFLFVQADGFALEQFPLAGRSNRDEAIAITLAPGRAVSGRFVDAALKGVAGVPIVVVNDPFTPLHDQVRGESRVDGSFHIAGLRADVRHVLVAWIPGSAMVVRSLGEIELGTPDTQLPEIVIAKESRVRGRFVDGDGAPIVRAEISCALTPIQSTDKAVDMRDEQPLDIPFGAHKTDAQGYFRFDGLFASSVVFTGLAQNSMKREIDSIAAGAVRDDVVIRSVAPLRQPVAENAEVGGSLVARVLHADGSPAARVAVELSPEEETAAPIRSGFTDDAGEFAFTELHGARYRVELELRDGFKDASPLLARQRLSPEALAQLMHSAERTIRLERVLAVKGRVVDKSAPDGRPWLVRVEIQGPVGCPTCVASDDHGRFEFSMESEATMTLWLSPLNPAPGVPRSGLSTRVIPPFAVRDLKFDGSEIVIEVP